MDKEIDLDKRMIELRQRSEHKDWDHVGYINWVDDQVDKNNHVAIEIAYPNGNKTFQQRFRFPREYDRSSEFVKMIECDELPFEIGALNNESLQDEPVPIDPDRETIVVPKRGVDRLRFDRERVLYASMSIVYLAIVIAVFGAGVFVL